MRTKFKHYKEDHKFRTSLSGFNEPKEGTLMKRKEIIKNYCSSISKPQIFEVLRLKFSPLVTNTKLARTSFVIYLQNNS